MYKRIIIVFSFFMVCISLLAINIYNISKGEWLQSAACSQNTYKLDIANLRGNIYDCRKNLLVNNQKVNIAAVAPCLESQNAILDTLSGKERDDSAKLFCSETPFTINLKDKNVCAKGVDLFKVPIRYSNKPLCIHTIGYLDSDNNGVIGIEKAYNDFLNETGSHISVKYSVDALGRILNSDKKQIDNKAYLQTSGVVLTIDSRIQEIIEDVGNKYIGSGAIIVTEVPSCKIRALASFPSFSMNNIKEALNDERCPFINRTITSYNVGSIFKLVSAATALEKNIDKNEVYNCCGSIKVDEAKFDCFNGVGHGEVDMKNAIAYSCNSYFVNLSKKISPIDIWYMSKNLGFATPIDLAPDFFSDKGNIPSKKELANPKTMASFSFGQSSLMAAPIQISGLINTIASDGEYSVPQLVEGLVNENFDYIEKRQVPESKKVISKENTEYLKESMHAAVSDGTATKGKPKNFEAAAKTATAETGLKKDGKNIEQSWYAGFYPIDKPKYSVVVLAENGSGGGESCGPVFKEIADIIYENLPSLLFDSNEPEA